MIAFHNNIANSFQILVKNSSVTSQLVLSHGHMTHSGSHMVVLFAAPWMAARQAPLSVGLSRKESWSALTCPPPGQMCDYQNQFHVYIINAKYLYY